MQKNDHDTVLDDARVESQVQQKVILHIESKF